MIFPVVATDFFGSAILQGKVEFARRLFAEENVTVLPGSYVGRQAHGQNPGQRRIRLALVANQAECAEAIARVIEFARRCETTPATAGAG